MFARTLSIVTLALLATSSALARLPQVANHIPQDAPVAIVIPSLSGLNDQIQTALAALEMPGMFTLEQGLATLGIRDGLDFNGSAAIVVPFSAIENEGEGILGLLPVTDFNAFVSQFGATNDNGIFSFVMGDNQTFAKSFGNFAVLSDSSDAVAAFTGQGNAGALAAKMGPTVKTIANNSGLYLLINHEPLAAHLGTLWDKLKQEMQTELDGGLDDEELGGMDPKALIGLMDAGFDAAQTLVEQSTATIVGVEVSAFGYSFETATSFTPGTQWAKVFSVQGNASSLFALLPNKPFLFASTFDMSMPLLKDMFTSLLDDFAPLMEQLGDMGGGQLAAMLNPDIIRLSDGQAQAMFVPEGGIMGGLLSGIIKIDVSSDPKALHEVARDMLGAMVGGNMMGDAATLTLDVDSVDVGNKKADAWSMQIGGAVGGNPMAAQFMGMFFGPSGGPAGLFMAGPRGIYTTYTQDPATMESLLNITDQNSLATDAGLQQVRGFLPENCLAEFYFSPQATIDMLLPMAAMMGMQMDLPELHMPPIGAGIATGNNEFHAKLFVPMPVVQGLGQLGMAIQQQMMQGQDDGQNNPPF
jgi:hypothetical protein